MKEQVSYKWKVCTYCMTFNHASFIEDAMKGFVMQQTKSPFVCLIIDDASTDGEPYIIREYLETNFALDDSEICIHEDNEEYELVFARHKENINCFFAVYLLKYNHYKDYNSKLHMIQRWQGLSEYVAVCEGDDYWLNEKKLQKQIDYLDGHPDVGMCYTNFHVLTEASGEMKKSVLTTYPNEYSYDYTLGDWIRKKDKCYVGPMTWVVRRELWESRPISQGVDGTFSFFAHFIYTSKTYCLLADTTAVYRINRGSMSQATSIEKHFWRVKGLHKQQLLLSEKYLDSDKDFSIEYINRVYYTNYFRLIYLLDNEEEMNKVKAYKNELSTVDRILLTLCDNSKMLSLYRTFYRKHYTKKNNFA